MADDAPGGDQIAHLAAAIHRFVRTHPEHFASRALVAVMARAAAGDPVPRDERMLALTSIVQALRERGGPRR
jgi:hypothetical protein